MADRRNILEVVRWLMEPDGVYRRGCPTDLALEDRGFRPGFLEAIRSQPWICVHYPDPNNLTRAFLYAGDIGALLAWLMSNWVITEEEKLSLEVRATLELMDGTEGDGS